jgi:hypothetical protein
MNDNTYRAGNPRRRLGVLVPTLDERNQQQHCEEDDPYQTGRALTEPAHGLEMR